MCVYRRRTLNSKYIPQSWVTTFGQRLVFPEPQRLDIRMQFKRQQFLSPLWIVEDKLFSSKCHSPKLNDSIREQDIYISEVLIRRVDPRAGAAQARSLPCSEGHRTLTWALSNYSTWVIGQALAWDQIGPNLVTLLLQRLSCHVSFLSRKHLRRNSQIPAESYYANTLIQSCTVSVKNAISNAENMEENL